MLNIKYYNKLQEWFINWALTPYSIIILFIISLLESIVFPIPPDIFLIALVLTRKEFFLKYTIFCTLGSITGAIIGYYIGYKLWWDENQFSYIANLFFNYIPSFTSENFLILQSYYNKYGFMIIFSAGFTPIPFKIFTISSGAFNMPLDLFLFASSISRFLRFFIVSILVFYLGDKFSPYIKKYFNKASIILVVIIFILYYIFK